MIPLRMAALPALALLVIGGGAAQAAGLASTYTSHEFQGCAKRPSPEPGVIEVRACAGHAGIPVIWTSEPDASSLAFGRVPAGDGPIPGLDRFYEVRGTVEWRGPVVKGAVAPLAAIVRYDTGPSVGRLSSSRLVVYRLPAGGAACVMGVVKGSTPDANAAARAIVERRAAGFVCGRDRAASGT